MRKSFLLAGVLIGLLLPVTAQAHDMSSSTARAETRYYAETLVERGVGSRYRVLSCRRHSGHAVSCAFRVYSAGRYRCGGRVRTASVGHAGWNTVSRATDSCH